MEKPGGLLHRQMPAPNLLGRLQVQEPEGNEENRCPDPDSKEMKINYAKELNERRNPTSNQ
jgi:hypothetical protein